MRLFDILPERRVATIEKRLDSIERSGGGIRSTHEGVPAAYRGERLEREFHIEDSARTLQGRASHSVSDADTLITCRPWPECPIRFIDLPQAVSLINRSAANNKLYIFPR